jgi:hypothetical protein
VMSLPSGPIAGLQPFVSQKSHEVHVVLSDVTGHEATVEFARSNGLSAGATRFAPPHKSSFSVDARNAAVTELLSGIALWQSAHKQRILLSSSAPARESGMTSSAVAWVHLPFASPSRHSGSLNKRPERWCYCRATM